MSVLRANPDCMLMDATALSNAFICEYMPAAPEGYVKVYLYALMLCHSGVEVEGSLTEAIAKGLDVPESDVEPALRYWERTRLIERISDHPAVYRMNSVQRISLEKRDLPSDDAYERFALSLYALFGDKRKLHGGDTSLAYEWVEQLGLQPEIVLMLVRHMIDTRGVHFSFKEAQKEAVQLREQQVNTPEAAEAFFSRSGATYKGTAAVLRKLGIKRQPSEPELDLYTKWTREWGYAQAAILFACGETVKGSPTFAYLDGVLGGVKARVNMDSIDEKQLKNILQQTRDETLQIREVLHALGQSRDVVDDGIRAAYRSLQPYGDDLVLLAAKRCGRIGKSVPLDKLLQVLESWRKKGLDTTEKAEAYLKEMDALDDRLRALSERMGKTVPHSVANRDLMRKWQTEWAFSDEMIDCAADFAAESRQSTAYMDKLLGDWHQKGIHTPVAAAEEHRAHAEGMRKQPAAPSAGKRVIEQNYSQRPIDPHIDDIPEDLLEEMQKL